MGERRPHADDGDEGQRDEERRPRRAAAERAGRAAGLEDEPAGAQQRVAGDDAEPAHHGKAADEAERAADKALMLDRHAVDQGAEHEPLAERGERRAAGEGPVPQEAETLGAEAELEGDAAKDER